MADYVPPEGRLVALDFGDDYLPPAGHTVALELAPDAGGPGNVAQFLFPSGTLPGDGYGDPQIRHAARTVLADGAGFEVFGTPGFKNYITYARPSGLVASSYGRASLRSTNSNLYPEGIAAPITGRPRTYNLLQFLRASGHSATFYGRPFLQGGVKHLRPGGLLATGYGNVAVINTRANRTLRPSGMAAPAMAAPDVSPRSIFPFGFARWAVGTALVQRTPAPKGADHARYGLPIVWFHLRGLNAAGFNAFDTGYARVFDPTRKLLPPSVAQAGIFGDIAIANTTFRIRPNGLDALEMAGWATLESNRRVVPVIGLTAPAVGASTIHNKTPSLIPPGLAAPDMPDALAIGYALRHVRPTGWRHLSFGATKVDKTPELLPKGMEGAIGKPTVWPRVRVLQGGGFDAARYGNATLWFRYRHLSATGTAMARYGQPLIEHSRRTLEGAGTAMARYGAPWVSYGSRTIAPPAVWREFASNHMVGGTRYLQPQGYVATAFGSRILPEIQSLYPRGFGGVFGLAGIDNRWKLVQPPGFISVGQQFADRWGRAAAFNLRQQIVQVYDPNGALVPPEGGRWTLIENRTRVLRTTGSLMEQVALPAIENKARPVLPAGVIAPATLPHYQAGMVAQRLRPLRLEGIEAPYFSTWLSARNDARVVQPVGTEHTLFGLAQLVNTRRYFPYIGGFDAAWFGYPMVADRIRTLTFEHRYTIAPPYVRLPVVDLYTRYVEAVGHESAAMGLASLTIRFNRVTTRWTLQNLCGVPAVRNLTPELHTRGRNSEDFGNAFLRLEWRPVHPDGALTQLLGRTEIAFRDRSMSVRGLNAGTIGPRTVVTKTGAPPYSLQTITLDAFEDKDGNRGGSHGIPPLLGQVPPPRTNQNVVRVISERDDTHFGEARVVSNGIRVEPGYAEANFTGSIAVSLKIRRLTVAKFPDAEVFEPSKARLSPHTIWAVLEAPSQAKDNHPSGTLHYVNSGYEKRGITPGKPRVRNVRRDPIKVAGILHTSYGQPRLQLRRRYLEPGGINSLRMGWHGIPGPSLVNARPIAPSQAFGKPAFSRPPYLGPQTIKPSGWRANFGLARVELLHRTMHATGFFSQQMGARKAFDTPYTWQGLRIGPLVPMQIPGFDSSHHGRAWASLRVRELLPPGFDAFLCEYQLDAFAQRLRVLGRGGVQPPMYQMLAPAGIGALAMGSNEVKPMRHYIRPDGNAEHYRKGAF